MEEILQPPDEEIVKAALEMLINATKGKNPADGQNLLVNPTRTIGESYVELTSH